MEKVKDNKYKCLVCGSRLRKLMIMMHTCRCKGFYCHKHLHSHDCGFDYTYMEAPRVEAEKVDKI